MLKPVAAGRQVIAVELQGRGHTADTGRAVTIEALACKRRFVILAGLSGANSRRKAGREVLST